jgi:hypothetical protein
MIVTAPATVTGNWKTQYQVTLTQSGLDYSAEGSALTVAGSNKGYTDLPFNIWVDNGGKITYSYTATMQSSVSEKQFVLSGQSGPNSPASISGPTTVAANYATQYYVKRWSLGKRGRNLQRARHQPS